MKNSEYFIKTGEPASVIVRLITDKPVKKTPYQVKGVFIKHYPKEEITPLLDGRYRKHFLYPRVQVKILNEQIYIIGIDKAADIVLAFSKKIQSLNFGNITFKVLDIETEHYTKQFKIIDRLLRYRFITPWIALNQTTGKNYHSLNNSERKNHLNRLLGQNIIFIAREMGVSINQKTYTKLLLNSLFPKPLDDNGLGAFYGGFQTNFILPNYIGIGNGITRGYGTIYGLYNLDEFNFDDKTFLKETQNSKPVEIKKTDPDLATIDIDQIQKTNNRFTPKKQGKRKKEGPVRVPKKENKNKSNLTNVPKPKKQEEVIDESKFNSPEYHKKQHKF